MKRGYPIARYEVVRLLNIYLDKNAITRLGPESGSDVFPCRVHAVFMPP